jgi:tetratricopeptide (TPR) repeat protein
MIDRSFRSKTGSGVLFPACLILVLSLVASALQTPAQEDDRTGEAIALFNKGQDAHEKGDLEGAVKLYEQALQIVPEFPEAELQRGNAFLSLGRTDDAEKAFRNAVKYRDDWTIALASLGSVLVQKSQFAEAEKLLVKSIKLDELNFPAYAALTELRIRTNSSPDVLRDLLEKVRGLTEKARAPSSVWAARSALESATSDRRASKQSAAEALKLDPKNQFALSQSLNNALADDDPAGAEGYLKRLEALVPQSENVKVLRVRVLAAQGKMDEAAGILGGLKNPGPDAAALSEAIRLSRSTNPAELEKLLASDPKNASVLGRLCVSLRTSDPAKAADYCRQAFELQPTNVNYAIGFGAALVQTRRYADAAIVLTKLVAVAPDNATAHANLATALFQLKRYPEAKAEYRWLVDKQPNLAAAYYFLGITHDQLGEYMDAMANYQQFLRLADPTVSKEEIEKVNLRLPVLQKQIKDGKGKKNG